MATRTNDDMTTRRGPIGVFDSGVGGLSTLKEIRRSLPCEDLIYFADSRHAPYGDKPAEEVTRRAAAATGFLVSQGAKAIVVACNTATAVAVDHLRAAESVPIVAMEPAVKPAVSITRSGKIGVLATTLTLASRKFLDLTERYGGRVEVLAQACPGLVEQVERGDLAGPPTRALVERYVALLLERQVDTIVLGCTHYSFLQPVIQSVCGAGVTIVDPSPAVARELRNRLAALGALTSRKDAGREQFWTTGSVKDMQTVMAALWPGSSVVRGFSPAVTSQPTEIAPPADRTRA
jgi:glutamate racemase